MSGAVVAGQPATDCENVDGGSTQETVASETDHSGSLGATPNVGPMQGMVALADCLGVLVAAPNAGPTRFGAQLVGWTVGWSVGRLVGWLAGWSDGLESLEAAPNAPVQPAMLTPTGDAGVRVTVPPGNAVNGEGLVGIGWSVN